MTLLKKLINFTRDIWNILGIALLMFVVIEAGFFLSFFIRRAWHSPAPEFRIQADTYADSSWAAKYYKEIEGIGRLRYRSYVGWRRESYNGEYITINSDGLRKTINISSSEDAGSAMKVFMFGGSTMWGYGTPDDLTIPSTLGREVKNKGINCEIINFGQYAYVSTQGVLELMLQLQKGNIPDAVIFYDGVNDTFGAFQSNVPGLPHSEAYREKEFNISEKSDLEIVAAQTAIRKLSIVRALNGVLKKTGLRRDIFQPIPPKYEKPISDRGALAHAVAETYINNIRLVQALSKTYNFACLFYLQPTIFQKQHLTEYERQSIELDFNYPGMKELYLDAYASIRQLSASLSDDIAFHDMSLIFSDVHEPIFVDFNHVGEKGNSVIAKRMAEDFLPLVRANRNHPINGQAMLTPAPTHTAKNLQTKNGQLSRR